MKTSRYREFLSISPSPGVRLCALHSDRYKTIRARVYFLEPIMPVDATANSLLSRVLREGSVNHPSRRELARACEELYGAMLGINVARFADVQAVVGTIEFPADRYLPKNSKELQQALGLLCEVLTQPALSDSSALRADVVAQEKYQLDKELRAMQDDKPQWATWQATQRTYAGTPGAIYEHGKVEDLAEITEQNLFTRHKLLVSNARVIAFVTGPVGDQQALRTLASALSLPRGKRPAPPPVKPMPRVARVKRDRMKSDVEQAHLVFAWTGAGIYGRDDYAPTVFADAILGGISTSRLFKIVREKHGLAYAVHTGFHRARGVITAQAAVDPGKADQATRLIRSEFARLAKSGFTEEEFNAARESLIESRKSALDSMTARAGDLVFQSVLGFRRQPEAQITDIKKVQPAQVRAILKRLRPHSEFRLG